MKINYKTMSKESKREFIKEVLIFSVGMLLLLIGVACLILGIFYTYLLSYIGVASVIVGFFLLVIGGIPLFQKGRFR